MLDKHLKKIREKEKKGRDGVRKARGEALKIIDSAHQEGREMIKQVKVEMDEKRREYFSEAEESAAREIEKMRRENEGELSSLSRRADGNRQDAVKLVMDRLSH